MLGAFRIILFRHLKKRYRPENVTIAVIRRSFTKLSEKNAQLYAETDVNSVFRNLLAIHFIVHITQMLNHGWIQQIIFLKNFTD